MTKYLAELRSPGCGHRGRPLNISGNAYAGPSGLKIACGVCGAEGDIHSYQTLERLPMVFGESKSYYEVTVDEDRAKFDLKPNLPIYREALKVNWQDELDDKTGEELLPVLDRAIADMVTHPQHYRGFNDLDWFGYDAILEYLKTVHATCQANPKMKVQLRLTMGDKKA